MLRRILIGAMLVLWLGVIFWFSAQDGSTSAAMSGKILKKLLSLMPDWDSLSAAAKQHRLNTMHFLIRKAAHFSEYAVLGTIASVNLRVWLPAYTKIQKCARYYLVPACFAVLYAAGDEWHQSFVPQRGPQLRDVCIDFAGACTGILLTAVVIAFIRRYREKKIQAENLSA